MIFLPLSSAQKQQKISRTSWRIRNEQGLSYDLMCMILRDACSYFERQRANDYANAVIKQTAQIQILTNQLAILQASKEEDAGDDNTGN